MPIFRHCHQMSHCYLSPCLSPQTLLCKRSSKGRIGWNFDSARSHSSQSRFLSVALSSCGTLWAHPLWGAGNSHHFQDAPAISLLSVTCALLPKSERGPSLPLLQGSEVKWSEVKWLSRVRLFVTLWTAAHQALQSMGFSRQEYWSVLPCSLGISNFLEVISSLSHSIVFLYFWVINTQK